jgi:hypothetical protein
VSAVASQTRTVALTGIDGGILPGFLAALGVLRLLAAKTSDGDVRLAWRWTGRWSPHLVGVGLADREGIAERIVAGLRRDATALKRLGEDDSLLLQNRFENAVDSLQHPFAHGTTDHHAARWSAALASEACPKVGKSPPSVDHTPLKALGGGKQRFIPTLIALFEDVRVDQVDRSLTEPWTYADAAPTLRLDPVDDRRHAHRWLAPMLDRPTSEAGGNALAAAALPLFVSVPTDRGLRTSGFIRRDATFVTWPIWSPAFDLPTITTLLELEEMHRSVPDRRALSPLGVEEILRSERIVVDKYVNFTPAWSP